MQLRVLFMQMKISCLSESIPTTSIRRISSKITVAKLCRNIPPSMEPWINYQVHKRPQFYGGSIPSHINFVFFLLGESPASVYHVPTPHTKTELTKCSDAGEYPERKHTTFRTRRKFEITLILSAPSNFQLRQ